MPPRRRWAQCRDRPRRRCSGKGGGGGKAPAGSDRARAPGPVIALGESQHLVHGGAGLLSGVGVCGGRTRR